MGLYINYWRDGSASVLDIKTFRYANLLSLKYTEAYRKSNIGEISILCKIWS